MEARPLLYSDMMTVTADDTPVYNGVPGYDSLRKVLDDKLAEYNESNAVMELVLFQQAMEHICRITRIISLPRGNAMLVGVGGSGKQSLARSVYLLLLCSFLLVPQACVGSPVRVSAPAHSCWYHEPVSWAALISAVHCRRPGDGQARVTDTPSHHAVTTCVQCLCPSKCLQDTRQCLGVACMRDK